MSQIYTSPEEAVAEFHRRTHLRAEVEAWWASMGWQHPPLPAVNGTPMGMIARCVATFRYEEAAFIAMCERNGIIPVWGEFTGDTFVSKTHTKLSLLQVHRCTGVGRKGGIKSTKDQFASANEWNGSPINTVIRRKDGTRLVDFHHEMLRVQMPEVMIEDLTPWLRSIGSRPRDFYEALLSIYIAHGIQFEDYDSDSTSAEADFRRKTFEPAWEATCERFGVRPMVVKLPYLHGTEYNYPVGSDWRAHGILPPEFGGHIPTCYLEPEGVIRVVHAWQKAGSRITVDQFLTARGDPDLRKKVEWLLAAIENESITIDQFLDSKGDDDLRARADGILRRLEHHASIVGVTDSAEAAVQTGK